MVNTKKSLIFLFCIILLSPLVIAQDYKIEISTLKDTFEAGEDITFKVSLLDSSNNPISDDVFVVLEDAEKKVKAEKTVLSNKFTSVNLGAGTSYGQGTIITTYKDTEARGFFVVGISELAKFEIKDDNLIITNIGNTQYTRTVQITIGDTTGIKQPKLSIGKSVSYRLVAPEGNYNIKVSDGKSESLIIGDVQLTGTGKVIGALDKTTAQSSGITGGISPDENSDEALMSYLRNSKFTYVFILVIFGAMILLAIERRYRKKVVVK